MMLPLECAISIYTPPQKKHQTNQWSLALWGKGLWIFYSRYT